MLDSKLKEEAIRLRIEEKLSSREIGNRLNVARSTVKSWFHRAGLYYEPENGTKVSVTNLCVQAVSSTGNPFSEGTMKLLMENPYVKSVTEKQVRFTPAFRQEYWRRYVNGQEPHDILNELGIVTELLGRSRIAGLHKRIVDAAANGFISDSSQSSPADLFVDGVVPAKALAQMQHELSYVKQELEFIKKIISLGKDQKS